MVNRMSSPGAGGGSAGESTDSAIRPETLNSGAGPIDDPYLDDGLTKEEKLFALGRLDSTGRCRSAPDTAVVSLHSRDATGGEVINEPLQLQIGWVCQAGFYPENLNKANQDNLLISTNLKKFLLKRKSSNGETIVQKELSIFGVFDGHGSNGTECSTFAVEQFTALFDGFFAQKHEQGPITLEELQGCIKDTLEEINKQMHKQKYNRARKPPVDDTLSGTTAIVVFMLDDTVIVANVGDSRAIIASSAQNVLEAQNLSFDQTPFRKDERKRCQQAGAVVMTSDQLEGYKEYDPANEDFGNEEDDGEDPPRLWLPNSGSPGVAFTRSLGDELAESIGCIATPELLRRSILSTDEFIVIASDGVFEFLTSQLVVDVVSKFTDAQQAAKALVAEAYKLWLHYEVRTDDITAIVIFLSGNEGYDGLERRESASAEAMLSTKMYEEELRPVRTKISKAKRKLLQKNEAASGTEEDECDLPLEEVEPKTEAELDRLRDAIHVNFFFHHLSERKLEEVLKSFKKVPFNSGDAIIRQGEKGDMFYVLDEGKLEVYVEGETEVDGETIVTRQLMTIYEPGLVNPSFGEQALMHSEPRTASVIARTDGVVWGLNRLSFRRAMKTVCNKDIVEALSRVPILETLSRSQLHRLADNVNEETFQPQDVIIRQGELRETFYVVKSGVVRCTIDETITDKVASLASHKQSFRRSSSRKLKSNSVKSIDDPEKQQLDKGRAISPSPPDATGDLSFDPHSAREVMRIEKGGYFGEQALLKDEPRGASVIAVEETTCFVINRSGFEQILGPLSQLLYTHSRKRQINARGKAQMLRNRQRLELPQDVSIADFDLTGTIASTGASRLATVKLKDGKVFVLKTYFKAATEEKDLCKQAENDRLLSLLAGVDDAEFQKEIYHKTPAGQIKEERKAQGSSSSSKLIPAVISTFVGLQGVHLLYEIPMCTPMYAFMEHPLPEDLAKFAAACVLSIISALHSKLVLCRSINPSSLTINNKGYVCLVELGYGKCLDDANDRTYTLCGDPAYLSPEALFHKGHGLSSDWWAMGIFVYEMLMASLPFDDDAANDRTSFEGDAEIEAYSKIVSFDAERVSKAGISQEAGDLVQLLLEKDPQKRSANAASLRQHPWVAAIDFKRINSAEAVSPLLDPIQEKLAMLEPASGKADEASTEEESSGLWYDAFATDA